MSEVDTDEAIRVGHELVFKNKLDFVITLSGLDLSASELKVAIYLGAFRANGTRGKCNPKVSRIAADTKLSVSGAEKAIKGLKDKGIIALIVKGKNTCDYYMAMPVLSAEVQASRESKNPPKQTVSNPPKRAGVTHPNRRVSYEQGNRTREYEISVGAGHRDADAALTGSCPSIDGQAVAGSSHSSAVDSDKGKEKEREINLYAAMKDGEIEAYPIPATESDLTAFMKRIVTECGNLDSEALYDIRRKFMAGELTDADIDQARRAAA